MIVCILFCCQKASIYYQTQNKDKIKTIFQDNVGRKFIIKAEIIDEDLKTQYQKSQLAGNLYVIDINDDSLKQNNNMSPKDKLENITLNHMAIILTEEETQSNVPNLNVYNLGILCFMSCVDCDEKGCPGKSPCSKLAIDMVRLWNSLGYNPETRDLERENKIKEELQELYNRGTGLSEGLPKFICDKIKTW